MQFFLQILVHRFVIFVRHFHQLGLRKPALTLNSSIDETNENQYPK